LDVPVYRPWALGPHGPSRWTHCQEADTLVSCLAHASRKRDLCMQDVQIFHVQRWVRTSVLYACELILMSCHWPVCSWSINLVFTCEGKHCSSNRTRTFLPYAVLISFPNARKFGPIQGGIWANYVQDIPRFQNNMGANFSVHLPIGVSFFKILTWLKILLEVLC